MPYTQPDGAIRRVGTDPFVDVQFSADGTRLYAVTGPYEDQITVFNVATGAVIAEYTLAASLRAMDLSADGRYLAVVSAGSAFRIDLTSGTVTTYATPGNTTDIAFLTDGTALVASGGQLLRLDFTNSTLTSVPGAPGNVVTLIGSVDDDDILIESTWIEGERYYAQVSTYTSGGIDQGPISTHNYRDPNPYVSYAVEDWPSGVGAVSLSGNLIVHGATMNVYDGSLNLLTSLADRFPYLHDGGLAFSPDESQLYWLSGDSVVVFDTATWDVIGSYDVGSGVLFNRERGIRDYTGPAVGYGDILQVSPDGRFISVIRSDGGIQVIDTTLVQFDASPGGDTLVGYEYGFGGNDTLSGYWRMYGGEGDDTYLLRDAGFGPDQVFEYAGQGTDTVQVLYENPQHGNNYVLPANVENLILLGSFNGNAWGNDLANVMIGNAAANILTANGGNDVLTGAAGVDTLTGGAGADTFRDTAAGLNGDVIADFTVEDRIVISDADPNTFTFSMSGNVLTFTGASLTLNNIPAGRSVVASPASGGGVQLNLVMDFGGRTGDFNGDGRDDILWRDQSGTVTNWLGQSDGSYAANAANFWSSVPTEWQVAGIGDFNGDKRDDILWRNADGTVTNWLGQANGAFSANAANVWASVPNDWNVVSVGDFNGDGRDDILWRHDGGTVTNWLGQANGGFTANAAAWFPVEAAWQIAGTGDFNGDGRDDILWRNADGLVTNWLGTANGSFSANAANVWSPVGPEWHIQGIGDFNGDGRDDILWRNDDGTVTDWLGQANGGFTANASNFWNGVQSDWHIDSIGDFNGDGRDDILWREGGGTITNWLGNATGGFIHNGGVWNPVPNSWQVQSEEFWL